MARIISSARRRGKDYAQPSAVFEEPRRAFRHARRGKPALVPGQAHALVLAQKRRPLAAVRGIAHRQVVAAVSQQVVGGAHVRREYAQARLQAVQQNAAAAMSATSLWISTASICARG